MIKAETKNNVLRMIKDDLKSKVRPTQIVMIEDSLNHVLADDIISKVDIPSSDISQIDGYAVNHESLYSVDYYSPIRFEITSKDIIDETTVKKVNKGDLIPSGADSVIDKDYVKEKDGYIIVNRPIHKGSGVYLKGSKIAKGDVVLKKNTKLNSFNIGLLASLNEFMVEVYKKVKVGVISVGNNITSVRDNDLEKDIDLNSYVILNELSGKNTVGISYGIINDKNENEIWKKATDDCDIIIILNSESSDFPLDYKDGKCYFDEILISPASESLIYNINDTLVYVFKSEPKDVYIGFNELVNPIINEIMGISNEHIPYIKARSIYNIPGRKGICEYVFVKISKEDEEYKFEAIDFDASYTEVLRDSDGYVFIDRDKEKIKKDETVKVTLI